MAIPDEVLAVLEAKFAVVLPHLDERQRRLYLAAEALGHGGIAAVARLAEVSDSTAARGRALGPVQPADLCPVLHKDHPSS